MRSKTLECLSPENLVVSWLLTPGNYKRWTSEAKGPLQKEITELMEARGIRLRSQRYVYDKIRNLEQSYMSARGYLMQQRQLTQFLEGKASQEVKKTALRKCSLFRELAAVFEDTDEVDGTESRELTHNGGTDSSRAQTAETKVIPLQRAQGKRKLLCDSPVTPDEKPTKRRKLENSFPPPSSLVRAPEVIEEAKRVALFIQDGNCVASSLWPINSTMTIGQIDERTAQRLAEQKLKSEEALAKCTLEGMQEREAIKTRVVKLSYRHKLKQEGCSDEQIDSAVPL